MIETADSKYKAKAAYLKKQEARLILQSQLNDKDTLIHDLKAEQVKRDDAYAKREEAYAEELSRLGAELCQLYRTMLQEENETLVLEKRATQLENKIKQPEMEKDKLSLLYSDLMAHTNDL